MHINVEPSETHAILHLRGEFDTYYCPLLQQEIEAVQKGGVNHVVLNLRLVKFINSTALGAILKASKALAAQGGRLVISRPSTFCRDILEKVGLDRVVPVHDTDEEAVAALTADTGRPAASGEEFEDDPSSVLFKPLDPERIEHFVPSSGQTNPVHGHEFGKNWSGVGRMSALSADGISFTWNGGKTDLTPFDMGQLLAVGTGFSVKFRMPLLQRGYCEANVEIESLEERPDSVKVACRFVEIEDATRDAVVQYAQDLDFLKDELRKATDA